MTEGLPFNGDRFIDAEIVKLIERFKIQTIIETGCKEGYTTRRFREMIPKRQMVVTIDIKEHYVGQQIDLIESGINYKLGSSAELLPKLLTVTALPVLAYLDAHGEGKSPLLDELTALAQADKTVDSCVVCIHDFFVLGQDHLGFDMVDLGGDWKEPLGFDLLLPYLVKIWPSGFQWRTNKEAEGESRGILYAYPKT